MTIREAIDKLDAMHPNSFSESKKVQWLNQVESEIYKSIILTHEKVLNPDGTPKYNFTGYTDATPKTTELIAEAPYDDLYVYYMEAQIDYADKETARYSNSIAMYNTAVTEFNKFYNARHKHAKKTYLRYF